jgi:hypothetical protein
MVKEAIDKLIEIVNLRFQTMEIQLDRDICLRPVITEDGDGVNVLMRCFSKNSPNVSISREDSRYPNGFHNKIRESVKGLDTHENRTYSVWFNPEEFKGGRKFASLESTRLAELVLSEEKLKALAKAIVDETEDIVGRIRSAVSGR